MKKRYLLTVYVLMLLIIVGLATSPVCAGVEKDTLVIGLKDNSVSLDPAICYEVSGAAIVNQVYDTLVDFMEGDYTQFVPALAESWELGEDGKTWVFHLRKGERFVSGNPVNADAVVFSLRRALKIAGTPVWVLTQFGITEQSLTKIDEYTVQLALDRQYVPGLFLSCIANQVASILDPELVMKQEQDADMGSAWLSDHSAGSGPYVIEERKRNEYLVLKANEHYWGEKPVFDRVILKNVQDSLEQITLLKQGTIDIAWDLAPEQVQELVEIPGYQTLETLTFSLYYLNMNLGYEPLARSEVRDAIRYAIDYDGLIDIILGGAAAKIQTFIPKGILGHNPAMPYHYDPQKAKQLLTEAGYPDGFEVELNCFGWSPWVDIAMKIKSDLADSGIRVNVNPLPRDQVIHLFRDREAQMTLIRWLFDYVDPDANAKPFAHSDHPGDDATFKLPAWRNHYVNLETSKLVEEAARELDTEKRKALYMQITNTILHDGPFVFLFTPILQYGLRSEIAKLLNPKAVSEHYLPIPYQQ